MSETREKHNALLPHSKPSRFEDIVIVVVTFTALIGAVLLKVLSPDAPPILIAMLTGTGVSALVYRFLGGVAPNTSVTVGTFKLGGTLAALVAVAWLIDQRLVAEVPGEQMITGTLEDLQGEEELTSRDNKLFTHRVYGSEGRFNYEWRIITSKKLGKGSKIPFYFERGLTSARSATKHELVVDESYYGLVVRIQYNRGSDVLMQLEPEQKELKAIDEGLFDKSAATLPKASFFDWASVLHAQAGSSPSQIVARLNSSDPIIRRDARAALARTGKAALPAIKDALKDPKAPYRIQLGTLVALNEMPGLSVADVSGSPFQTALATVVHPDATLSGEALRFLTRFAVIGSALPASGSVKISARAGNPHDGDFLVLLTGTSNASGLQFRFDEIDCFQNGSLSDPRWRFQIVAGTQRVALPERRFIGTKTGNRYTMTPNERKIMLTITTERAIRVIGYKPTFVQ
jgi:hypothetical protein